MSAPPLSNSFDFKLNSIKCIELNHENNPIVGLCQDLKCERKNKLMCLDCIFDHHGGHIGIKSKEIEEIVQKKYKEFQNNQYGKQIDDFKKKIRKIIDDFKIIINNQIENYYINVLKSLEEKTKLKKENQIKIIIDSYPPKNQEDFYKIENELLNLCKNKNDSVQKGKENLLEIFKSFENNLTNQLEITKSLILLNLKDLNLNNSEEEDFEWLKTTYNLYDFYYKLEENNSKATKISGDGTITVCRGNNPLKKGNKYKLDYFINYNNGDFDVGFGDDETGKSDWLRSKKAYCISNYGIFLNNKKASEINLIKNKKISFLVNLNTYFCEIFMDDVKKYDFNFDSNYIYYPMIAIRNLNNSVKLKIYKI